MQTKIRRKKVINLFLNKRGGQLFGLFLLTCISCSEQTPVIPESNDTYHVNITLSAGNMATRTGGHDTEAATVDESFIKVDGGSDYAVFVLNSDGTLLTRLESPNVTLTGEGNYTINGAFETKQKPEKVKLLVLANWQRSFGSDYNFVEGRLLSEGVTNALNEILTNATNYNFDYTPDAGNVSWKPVNNTKGIPMVGVSDDITPNDDVYELDQNINMLRALAKIEIVDAVPGDMGARISDVTLSKYNTKGRFVPDVTKNPAWNVEGTQVVEASLPLGLTQCGGTGLKFNERKAQVKLADNKTEAVRSIFEAYIPEMDLRNFSETERPVINITAGGKDYTVQLARYEGKKDPEVGSEYDYLLRNHIYRYRIVGIGIDADLTLLIDTPEWDVDDDQEWTYEDANPTFVETLKWVDYKGDDWNYWDYETDDVNDLKRILIIGDTDESAAYGTFTMTAPKENNPGTWILSVISDDDTLNDHFKVEVKVDGEWVSQGEKGDTYTSDITGNKISFRIIASGQNSSATDYTARVVLTVKTFDDRIVNVKLTDNNETDPKKDKYYYSVKQLTNGGDNM